MKREDTYSVRVTVAGTDLGVYDKMSGGGVDSNETKYRPGGLADEVTLGGSRAVANVTASKLYDENVHGLIHWLYSQAGKADMVVTKQPLDANGAAFGRPIVYRGSLKAVKAPDVDSTSSAPALVELELSTAGSIA